jgi:3-hydroxy-9,10-secoandrosta-1,3,5(10)-triene-9,17-dione monooxygenase reductase component
MTRVSQESFRKVMSHFATGVTVVTLKHPSGRLWGFTVNAFSSVSLTPPLILYCVDHAGESFAAAQEAEYFAVNFLAEDQESISRRFASKTANRFEGIEVREGAHGSPLIARCLGYIECRKVASHRHGDHTIVVGEVLDAEAGGGNPLLFYRSAYGRMGAAVSTP